MFNKRNFAAAFLGNEESRNATILNFVGENLQNENVNINQCLIAVCKVTPICHHQNTAQSNNTHKLF